MPHGLDLGANLSLLSITAETSSAGVETLVGQPSHSFWDDDVFPEAFLLQQLQCFQRWSRIAVKHVSATDMKSAAAVEPTETKHLRQMLDVFGLGKVLEILQVLDELRVIQKFLSGQVVQVERVGQALDKLRS